MFSFEGNFKKPRTINYSKEKDLGKTDLIENAKYEREKRALLSRQIVCAGVIQRRFRQYLVKKTKRQEAFTEFHNLIGNLQHGNTNSVDHNLLKSIVNIADKLLIFFDGTNTTDDSLKRLIESLIRGDILKSIISMQPINNYYNAVTFSLLLRVLARYLATITEHSLPVTYNLFLRFFELFFTSLEIYNSTDVHLKSFHGNVLKYLTDSNYFHHMSLFICRQMIQNNDPIDNYYNHPKINYVLKMILLPVKQSKNLNILTPVVIRFIKNIYTTSYQNHSVSQYKLMSLALLEFVEWEAIVDIIFTNFESKELKMNIACSPGLIYFLLGIPKSVMGQSSPSVTKACAQILILFFQMSSSLIANNELFISNDISITTVTDEWTSSRNDLDFDMKDDKSDHLTDSGESSDDEKVLHSSKEIPVITKTMSILEQEIALSLKSKFSHIILPLAILNDDPSIDRTVLIDSIGYVYHLLVLQTKLIGNLESKTFILNLIQTSKTISRRLWNCSIEHRSKDLNKSVMDALIKWEIRFSDCDLDLFFGKLLCFANCLHWRLLSVQDLDLISPSSDRSSEMLEFSSDELCTIVLKLRDIMVGLIYLIYPSSSQFTKSKQSPIFTEKLTKLFIELQRVVIRLYNRDVRKGLKMSGKRLEWVMPEVCRVNVNKLMNFKYLLLEDYKFGRLTSNQLTSVELRQFVVLKEMPFIVPIGTRMLIFKHLVSSNAEPQHYIAEANLRIRRDYLYEDAFNQITKHTVPNLRRHLKIQFIDRFGIDEEGIDGGGLMREFLSRILLDACDPKRGLFVSTTNNLLYPNPEIATVYPDNWQNHLFFVGRMLGFTLFKGLLVEVPLAPFFLQRLLSNKAEIDIDNLQYLDEDLYRNLLSLKSMGRVEDMSLDFTLARNCYGASTTVDLKPGGGNVLVTDRNKIEYIYLVAEYKLDRQIAKQTAAIMAGLNDVLPVQCFQLFDLDEMSVMIAGGGAPIDVEDLRRHTVYQGGHGPEHPVIRHFWAVLGLMTEDQKRSFVQFVTSLSRAPMLGFAELSPQFAIIVTPDTDRLPTASTCLNLLKLPAYESQEEMRDKLLYAIGSDTGFHLS